MKYLVLIPDGMADRPSEKLGGHTPMEIANKPMRMRSVYSDGTLLANWAV